ncbi:hypothetical protein GBA52_016304 [Prunus armeniaca]|nr:hypothetical protein GBA52_016304 [Prunus armeniaca]
MKSMTTAGVGVIYTRHRPVTLRRVGCHRLFWANATGNCNLKTAAHAQEIKFSLRVWCGGGWNGPWDIGYLRACHRSLGSGQHNSECTCAGDAAATWSGSAARLADLGSSGQIFVDCGFSFRHFSGCPIRSGHIAKIVCFDGGHFWKLCGMWLIPRIFVRA